MFPELSLVCLYALDVSSNWTKLKEGVVGMLLVCETIFPERNPLN